MPQTWLTKATTKTNRNFLNLPNIGEEHGYISQLTTTDCCFALMYALVIGIGLQLNLAHHMQMLTLEVRRLKVSSQASQCHEEVVSLVPVQSCATYTLTPARSGSVASSTAFLWAQHYEHDQIKLTAQLLASVSSLSLCLAVSLLHCTSLWLVSLSLEMWGGGEPESDLLFVFLPFFPPLSSFWCCNS